MVVMVLMVVVVVVVDVIVLNGVLLMLILMPVIPRNQIHVFSFPNKPTKLFSLETRENPLGLCEVS